MAFAFLPLLHGEIPYHQRLEQCDFAAVVRPGRHGTRREVKLLMRELFEIADFNRFDHAFYATASRTTATPNPSSTVKVVVPSMNTPVYAIMVRVNENAKVLG